jgi:ketol-acid reductoisomerase
VSKRTVETGMSLNLYRLARMRALTRMVRIWKDDEIILSAIKKETIAVIGYGIQGAAQASNMRDSGLNVIVGLREGGATWGKAKREGHKVTTVAAAVKKADVVHVLIPDMQQANVYKK